MNPIGEKVTVGVAEYKIVEDEIVNTNLGFESFKLEDSEKSKECAAANDKSCIGNQKGTSKTQEKSTDTIKLHTCKKKKDFSESSLRGNWTLICNPNSDINGRSEAQEALKKAKELHTTRPDIFLIHPYYSEKQNGTVGVYFYTPDYTDKEFNLKVARAIREEIHYPYVMYYHKRVVNLTSFYMHTPNDEFYVNTNGMWILKE